jgi:uncharacterized protein (UPF0261 family)
MQRMARGAALLAARMHADGLVDGLLALGGTMGTDLALDVASALPLGVPKVLVSTVAHSHLLPPQRIPVDLIGVLWAGGLHGLNALCESALAQAAGAVVGACRNARPPAFERPLIGMTSLGATTLRYMKTLRPALEARGYELAVFHCTGMGGQAFEALAAQGRFAAVFDFCLQELANAVFGSCVTAGPDRLLGASRAGIPQLVAPGALDMVDFPAWGNAPPGLETASAHRHNRLIASAALGAPQRRRVAAEVAARLAQAWGPTCLLLPLQGIDEWDRTDGPMHDPLAQSALVEELRRRVQPPTQVIEIDAHINDAAFCEAALRVFDRWVEEGRVVRPRALEKAQAGQ